MLFINLFISFHFRYFSIIVPLPGRVSGRVSGRFSQHARPWLHLASPWNALPERSSLALSAQVTPQEPAGSPGECWCPRSWELGAGILDGLIMTYLSIYTYQYTYHEWFNFDVETGCHRMPSDAIGCHRMPSDAMQDAIGCLQNIKWRKPHKPPVKPWDTNRHRQCWSTRQLLQCLSKSIASNSGSRWLKSAKDRTIGT